MAGTYLRESRSVKKRCDSCCRRVVPLSPQMIGLRFTVEAEAAGIERRVTAHSGRVGLASSLPAAPLRATCYSLCAMSHTPTPLNVKVATSMMMIPKAMLESR